MEHNITIIIRLHIIFISVSSNFKHIIERNIHFAGITALLILSVLVLTLVMLKKSKRLSSVENDEWSEDNGSKVFCK